MLLRRFVFRRLIMVFYLRAGNSDGLNIFDQTEIINQIMVVSVLQIWSHGYSSHYNIIKFVGFELIYYAINMGVVSFSMILAI